MFIIMSAILRDMSKERPRSAWIIEWRWFGDHRKVEAKLLHVLNPRVKDSTVISYMKCLYMNSELVAGLDRLGFLSSKYWKGMVIHEGPRISVGANPFLMAWHVKDLTIEIDYKSSREVFHWTQVPGRRYNEETHEFEDLGQPMKREESLPYG
jgi:hypothetical protein